MLLFTRVLFSSLMSSNVECESPFGGRAVYPATIYLTIPAVVTYLTDRYESDIDLLI